MKTIFSKVKLRPGQIVQLFLLVLLSAVGQMLLPSFLAQMISHGVAEGVKPYCLDVCRDHGGSNIVFLRDQFSLC